MKYLLAASAKEALDALIEAEGNGRIISGGSDLTIDMEVGKIKADVLVDVMNVPEMKKIFVDGDELVIGAAATLTEISRNELVLKYFPSLAEGTGCVGSLQIRNSATLTGNVVSAQPAADGGMAVAPLDPTYVILSADGIKKLKTSEMYAGFGRTAIDPSKELVTEIRLPLPKENEASSYVRIELRKSLSLPMLNAAAMAAVKDGKVEWVRITMGPVGVGPVRASAAEDFLTGKELTFENMEEAGRLSLVDAKPRSNPLRGSKEYRETVLPVLIRRALEGIAMRLGIEY